MPTPPCASFLEPTAAHEQHQPSPSCGWAVVCVLPSTVESSSTMESQLREPFRRFDESPDAFFYRQPRFVTHIDEPAVAAVTQLYRDVLPAGGAVLDLMSSWVSHLPPEVMYRRVVGIGMNEDELASNPRLDARQVKDLNREPVLEFDDGTFDAATICVSIQYLAHPVDVLRELGRVVSSGGPLVIT